MDRYESVKMILRNRDGDEAVRIFRMKFKEVLDDGDKSVVLFDDPADVKGTALLSFSHPLEQDDQWLYLPALKRVKRISSKNKSGPFMASEFAYEDIASQEAEKFRYTYLRDERLEGMDCFVLEREPLYAHSGYRRQIVWLDKEHYRVYKIESYDRRDRLLKTLNMVGYQRYLNQFWRPDKISMVNHQSGKSTDLLWSEYAFRINTRESDFKPNSLKRLR